MRKRTAKAPSQRQLRVGEEVRHILAAVFERGDIHDPVLAATSVTVTEVRCSPDLRHATAFVVPLGGGDTVAVIAALKRVKPYLRAQLARQTALKFVPDLSFQADTTFDQASRIDVLLRDLGDGPDDGA